MSILKLSRINVTGLSGKNLAKLIIQLQTSKFVQNGQDVISGRRNNAMQSVDISWNNLNIIGLKSFFNTLNGFEEKVRLHFLDATWVGLQDSCLNTVLAFLGSPKSAAIPNIKLVARENGEGGGINCQRKI